MDETKGSHDWQFLVLNLGQSLFIHPQHLAAKYSTYLDPQVP